MSKKDSQSRKWQITINNPIEKELDHEHIVMLLNDFKSLSYYCMADEKGETHHTHVYAVFNNPVRFSSIKSRFGEAHIEMARGTSEENRDYIRKTGKWENDEKHGTIIPDTFEECGDIPEEHQGERSDLANLLELIRAGYSNYELVNMLPEYMFNIDRIEKVRQLLKAEEYKEVFRSLYIVYIWGRTGTGKTRSVMELYGYSQVYRVTDYTHPFDGYACQDVILFDEYRSQIRMSDMLVYLEGHPMTLPSRYANKQACFTTVFIISNIPLEDQYPLIQVEQKSTWEAFLRRINEVIHFPDKPIFTEIDNSEPSPFDEPKQQALEDTHD